LGLGSQAPLCGRGRWRLLTTVPDSYKAKGPKFINTVEIPVAKKTTDTHTPKRHSLFFFLKNGEDKNKRQTKQLFAEKNEDRETTRDG
jgi:hypothetical protein